MKKFLRAGKARLENKRLIQRYIDKQDMDQTEFAESIGVTKQALSKVINGRGHIPAVLDGLRKIGVPEELLWDPRREETAQKLTRQARMPEAGGTLSPGAAQ